MARSSGSVVEPVGAALAWNRRMKFPRRLPVIAVLVLLFLVVGTTPVALAAGASGEIRVVQTLIQTGNPERAVKEAKRLLARGRLSDDERLQLLNLIADAEYIRASAGFFEDIDAAVEANKTLLREFPQRADGARIRWRIVKLYWKHKQVDAALAASQSLRRIHAGSEEAHRSWLVDAQIYYHLGRYSKARSALLQFSLKAKGKKEQARLQAWTAMVNIKEGRFAQAIKQFDSAFRADAEIVRGSPELFTEYIKLLARQERDAEALQYCDDFLNRYSETILRRDIRMVRADILAKDPGRHREEATLEYMFISEHYPDSTIGRQAFMRKMMIQVEGKDDFHSLKPVLVALKKLARRHQMSVIEDEATLDQAILWARLANSKAKDAPKGAINAALENFSRAANGITPRFRERAKALSWKLFEGYLKRLIDKRQWLQAVVLWTRYPSVRDRVDDGVKLGVAKAMRLLALYDQAETLLKDLYRRHAGTLRGEQIKLEQARLWVDRADPKGVDRINRWLSEHEFTIYRPEMQLLVAQMQFAATRFDAAAQSIRQVSPDDLVYSLRADYWKLRANIAEARKRWHVAAHAWQVFGKSDKKSRLVALRREALALFKAGEYEASERLWLRLPESEQDAAWRYYLGMSRLRNGKWQMALKMLRELSQDKEAGVFSALASLALAEHEANNILKEAP